MSQALYHEALVALARSAVGAGRLAAPDVSVRVDNPLCGDEVTLDLGVSGGRIDAIGHRVRGCLLCEASAAWAAQHAVGADVDAVERVLAGMAAVLRDGAGRGHDWERLEWDGAGIFAPVHAARSRHRCVLLPLEALAQAAREALRGAEEGS